MVVGGAKLILRRCGSMKERRTFGDELLLATIIIVPLAAATGDRRRNGGCADGRGQSWYKRKR